MPAKRDARTGKWFFRAVVKYPDGRRERIFGTPGVPGAYQDLANTKAGAIEAENRAKANALHGKPSAPIINEPREVPTLNEYAETFLANYLPEQKPSALKEKRQVLKGHVLPALGALRLDAIRQVDIDAFVKRELKRISRKTKRPVSRKTVNNRLAVLSTLLGYAHANGLIAKPTLRFVIDGSVKAKDATVHPVERVDVIKLRAAANDVMNVAILLAADAGLRVGEIRALQWGDLKSGVLRVARAIDIDDHVGLPKHDKQRTVPLSPALTTALRDLPRRGLFVVCDADGDPFGYDPILDRVNAVYARAGVEVPRSDAGITMPWHSLRHTFGTECAMRGVALPVLQELMGHADIKTTLRYVRVSEAAKHDAIALAFGHGSHVAADTRVTT